MFKPALDLEHYVLNTAKKIEHQIFETVVALAYKSVKQLKMAYIYNN